MDSTMMYLHVKKIGNESVDPVKNLPKLGQKQNRFVKYYRIKIGRGEP